MQPEFPFENFNQLILGRANTSQQPPQDFTKLSESIIHSIDQCFFQLQSKAQAEFYIHKTLLTIDTFEFKVREELETNDSISREKALKQSLQDLDDIRFYIENTYHIYIDTRQHLSRRGTQKFLKHLNPKKELLEGFLNKSDISPKLKKITLKPLQRLTDIDGESITHQKKQYLNTYLTKLIQWFETSPDPDAKELLEILCVLNFNSIGMLSFMANHYNAIRDELDDNQQYLDYLQKSRHCLRRIRYIKGTAYSSDLPPLKTQVNYWLKEEITIVKHSIKQESTVDTKTQKLRFQLSVEVITSLFRLLHDTKNTSSGANQTVRWLAKNISSKNQLNISQQSVQRKFFEKHSDKQPLKELLDTLLNYLNRK